MVCTFVKRWIASIGCTSTITTDRGRQFKSGVLCCLTAILGITRYRTTAYHPQGNGLVERFQQQLKALLSVACVLQWTNALPLVLLSIRNSAKTDDEHITVHLVYVTTLRLPADFVGHSSSSRDMDLCRYASWLKNVMRSVKPVSTQPQSTIVGWLILTTHYTRLRASWITSTNSWNGTRRTL